jgi:hypothetical protein
VALGWLVELFGLPRGTGGGFVTGATVANFTALAAARSAVLARAGWDVEASGLFGAPVVTVVIGQEAHPTLIKSLGLLGLGRRRVVVVPTDAQGRMRAEALPRPRGPRDRVRPGRQREHRCRGPAGRDCRARPRGRGMGPRRRRLRSVGGPPRRHAPGCSTALRTPTRGRPTATSG